MIKKQLIKFFKFLNHNRLIKYKKKLNYILGSKKISFLDIGASIQIIPRWKRLDKKNLEYILFEPNKDEIKKLDKNKNFYLDYKIYDTALSNKNTKLTLNITKGIYQSSILEPNFKFINQFLNPSRYKIIKKERMTAKRLDSIKISNSDFIKVDTQGYNYEILQGSQRILKSTLGVETEAEFTQIYKGQKLFGNISDVLNKNNFEFIDFITLRRWNRKNLKNYGQCVFGNALFLKKPEYVFNLPKDRIIKYIAICTLYNKFDLVDNILKSKKFNKIEKLKIKESLKFFKKYSNTSRNISKVASFLNRSVDYESEIHLFQ